MGRPRGAKNKRTLLREAEQEVIAQRLPTKSLSIAFSWLRRRCGTSFYEAETGKAVGRSQPQVDEDYKQAATLAALAAPYRHAKLSAVKLAGDPNNPVRVIPDDLSSDELRAEVNKHIVRLDEAGVLDLEALLASKRRMAN
jgi:hypothetical protein